MVEEIVEEAPRVGVYICHCGLNIAGVVDVEDVAEYVEKLPNVVTVKHYVYMCSQPGQDLIKKDIEEHQLNRVVVASCSPRMHEPTFQRALEEAGVNPFFFEMSNIREQVSWVHSNESDKATKKAKTLIRMAIARAKLLEPISKMEVPVTKRVLVVGAGVSGMNAAVDLAESGFEVYLIEHNPFVGGHLSFLNRLYSGRDSSEILNPLIEGLYNPNIILFLNSEVKKVEGYIGNFNVQIVKGPRYVNENCIQCGRCVDVCPVSVPNHLNSGIGERKAVYFPFKNCHPPLYVIDEKDCIKCGKCLEVCPSNAIDLNEKSLEIGIEIGAVIVTTGFETYKPIKGEFGYGMYEDVITQLTLERLLSDSGPTGGELVKPSDGGGVDAVAFILCVGSRQGDQEGGNAYCSRFCCTTSLKNAYILKERRPEIEVYVIYRDIRTFGRGHEDLYRRCRERGVLFIKYDHEDPSEVSKTENGVVVTVRDLLFGVMMELEVDLVVLAEGMVPPRDIEETQMLFSLTRSTDGFFQEAHPKLNPLDTFTEGVFIGGAAQGPKDVEDAISQASGAAAKAAILLHRGKVIVNLVTATVDKDLCVGCGKCVNVCPYNALEMDEEDEIVEVTEVKCKGCGSCSSTCPVGAIQVRHYLDDQILAMVETSIGV